MKTQDTQNTQDLENLEKIKTLGIPNIEESSSYYDHQISFTLGEIENLEREDIIIQEKILASKKLIVLKNIETQIIESLKNYKLENKKDFILNVINTAITDIFQDNIRIDIEQEITKAGKIKYNIVFYQNDIQIAKNEELLETNGGGVLSIISVLFKILIGYIYSKNKFYIFDESFSQVSPEYRERLSLFLRNLAEEYNFTIVIVSQTGDLNTHAHMLYKINYKYTEPGKSSRKKKGTPDNKLKEMYIEEIKENPSDKIQEWYYSEIRNFQSIKSENFAYKGFTVIVGPNNSGKSASLRAIKSLIFNSFKEKYLRIGESQCSVTFGRNDIDGNNINIKLIYKSKKVLYIIEGKEYLGKTLAADIIKKEVEKIGFRYIDIKSLYKNIKGDLRTQAEQISYSSQYDNLFLVGSKSNDIEKIFNFLFNTEHLTSTISVLKEEILIENGKLKELENKNHEILESISIKKEYLLFYKFMYNFKLLEEYQKMVFRTQEFLSLKETMVEFINKVSLDTKRIESIIQEIKYIDYYIQTKNYIESLKEIKLQKSMIIDKSSSEIKRIQEIQENIKNYSLEIENLENYLNFYRSLVHQKEEFLSKKKEILERNSYDEKELESIHNIIEEIFKIENNLNSINELMNHREDQKSKKLNILKRLNDLEEEISKFDYEYCPTCLGKGILHKI